MDASLMIDSFIVGKSSSPLAVSQRQTQRGGCLLYTIILHVYKTKQNINVSVENHLKFVHPIMSTSVHPVEETAWKEVFMFLHVYVVDHESNRPKPRRN